MMVSQGTGSSYGSDDQTRGMPGDTGRSGEKSEQFKEVAGQVKEQAAQMTDQVKEQASKVTDKARDQATSRADEQKERAAQGIVGIAGALSQVSSSMRDQNPAVANFADTAASRLESFAGSLNDKDVSELMNDVERMARRQPALFIGGAFLAGVFAARFLKSSSGMSGGGGSQGSYDTRGFSSQHTPQYSQQYGRPTGGSSYGSTYGTTGSAGYGTTRSGQTNDQTGGYRGGTTTGTTGRPDTLGATRTGSATSGQTYSPFGADDTTSDTTGTTRRSTPGTSGSSTSS
ncbi:MAG: hypothetical protein WEC79_04375 [Thermomicrobiales bacterium]